MGANNKTQLKALLDTRKELDNAARIQTCPACKKDIVDLSGFISAKMDTLKTGKPIERKNRSTLVRLDYLNEMVTLGILFSDITKPIAKHMIKNVPDRYRQVLEDNIEMNKRVRKHLVNAKNAIKRIIRKDRDYPYILRILDSFIASTDFKLSVDPITLFLLNKVLKYGHKTRLLELLGWIIVHTRRVNGYQR